MYAFWVTKEFELKQCLLAVEHFGTDYHTGDNILKHYKIIRGVRHDQLVRTCRYGQRLQNGLRMRDSPRLDCLCHRLHTVFTDAYKETQRLVPELKKYEDAAAALCKYVKQATRIRETLPVSFKQGGNTRPWTSIYHRAHSIHESYTKLSEKLTERVRLPLLAVVDKDLNKQILDVKKVFNKVFENLQYSTRPTITLLVPSYNKISIMVAHEDFDSLEIATLEKNIHSLLDEKFYRSITQLHWIATVFDPGFKSFSFLPDSTPADKKFKQDLLKDLPGWLETLADQQRCNTAIVSSNRSRLLRCRSRGTASKEKRTFFVSMHNKAQQVTPIGDPTISLDQEYNMNINGEVTSGYDEEDPLTYWATVQHRLPLLGKLARQMLCCPATSAQSERDFLHTGSISTSRR